jgi:hypothetical protein
MGMGIAFCLAASAAFAQPVLDSYYDLNITSEFTLNNGPQVRRADSLNIMGGIAGRSWKYDFISVRAQIFTVSAFDSGMTSGKRYKTSTDALDDGSSRALYFRREGNDLLQIGDAIAGTADLFLKPGQVTLPFYLPYQGTPRIYSYRRDLEFDPTFIISNIFSDTVRYAGYGEFTLNGNFYSDALLIVHSRKVTDGNGGNAYTDKVYQFLIPQLGYPILQVTTDRAGKGAVQFVDQENIIVSVRPRSTSALGFSPNPSHREVNIAGAPATETLARFISVSGHVAERTLSRGVADITGLAPGVYTVQVGSRKGRLVVE